MANPREYTCRLLEMVDSGIISADDVMNAAMSYMSDSDVEDMMHMNQWDNTIDEDGTEEDDSGEETAEDEITVGDTVNIDESLGRERRPGKSDLETLKRLGRVYRNTIS